MLEVRNLTKRFGGVVAVADFSFSLADGEILGLIGPNGAGKTTVFNLITGMFKPTSGTVLLDGEDITGLPPHRLTARGLVRTFQNLRLMKGMSLAENMRPAFHLGGDSGFVQSLFHTSSYVTNERRMNGLIDEALDKVGILEFRDANVDDLAYGIQKRAELARAILFRPKYLFLDEPAAGLNPQETADIMELVRGIQQESGCSMIVVEHNMQFIMRLSHRIVVMDQGNIIAEGEPAYVQTHPDVIKAYLGERAWKRQTEHKAG